ncbi:MAG: cation diffusion facilitator family transporter [Rubricoccaceae bacterium]
MRMLMHAGHHQADASASSSAENQAAQRWAIRASLAVAVLMLVGKLYAYAVTGSTAIFSDALESVVHLGATAMAAFSLWYASKPPDPSHPYGHGKIAYFSSGVEGGLILVAAGAIVYEAIRALIEGPEIQSLGMGLLITAVLGAINLMLGLTLIRVGKRTNAIVLVANGHHVLTDMWTSLGVLVGIGLVWITDIVWLDPLVALLLGLNILWTSGKLMRDAYSGLMERVDEGETERVLKVLAQSQEAGQISGYHHVRHRRVNDQIWLEQHLLLPDGLSLYEAHQLASRIEARQRELFSESHVQITSHLEPVSHEHGEGVPHDGVEDPLPASEA